MFGASYDALLETFCLLHIMLIVYVILGSFVLCCCTLDHIVIKSDSVDALGVGISRGKRWTHVFPNVWTVGAALSSPKHARTFIEAIERQNNAPVGARHLPVGVRLNSTYIIMDSNPIRAAKTVCEELIPSQPYVVIASRSAVASDLSPMAVSFTCGFYKIPVVGLSARESTFSDKVFESDVFAVPTLGRGCYSDHRYADRRCSDQDYSHS